MQKVYNDNDFEPEGYKERHTVRCVILDDDKKQILFFGDFLVGGGVDAEESDEEAIHREALEEVGAELEIIKPLGEVVSYRDEKKKVYISRGYLCKYIRKISEPTTTIEEEMGVKAQWYDVNEAISRLEREVKEIVKNGKEFYGADLFQVKLHMNQGTLDFIQEALK